MNSIAEILVENKPILNAKDSFCRFDLLPHANWERLQLETARNVILDIEQQTDNSHFRALIFDDSLYQRFRGKGTQLCAKVFDHKDRKMRLKCSVRS